MKYIENYNKIFDTKLKKFLLLANALLLFAILVSLLVIIGQGNVPITGAFIQSLWEDGPLAENSTNESIDILNNPINSSLDNNASEYNTSSGNLGFGGASSRSYSSGRGSNTGSSGPSAIQEIDINRKIEVFFVYPNKNFGSLKNSFDFAYNVSGENILSCFLLVDSALYSRSEDITLSSLNYFYDVQLEKGKHFLEIVCRDEEGNFSYSGKIKINVFETNFPFELPFELEEMDIANLSNLSFKINGLGKISFQVPIDLSEAENLSNYVQIKKNFIGIDSELVPYLNKPAILTFYGLDFENPIVFRDGEPCLDCSILDYRDGSLTFFVSHFSNYTAGENSELEIWDDTDILANPPSNISFYANYTNVTDKSPILGANCNIFFNDSSSSIPYDSGSGLYKYNRSFSSLGVYYYNVSCSASGFTGLNLSDYVSIDDLGGPNGADVFEVSSQTSSATSPQSHAAVAGNLSEIVVSGISTTQSWQGYYGNVSGAIELADASGNAFYNWSAESSQGEVYSTRANDFNFATVKCAESFEISNEELNTGQNSSDVDSVSSTFNSLSHPEFFVGSVNISSNSCSSTNIYGLNGQSSDFYEVLLSDGASNIAYTSLIEQETLGFNGASHDFEMIVAENGHGNVETTTYYFYVEFG